LFFFVFLVVKSFLFLARPLRSIRDRIRCQPLPTHNQALESRTNKPGAGTYQRLVLIDCKFNRSC
jgi:hypothetical protein